MSLQRSIVLNAASGSLGTLSEDGAPFVSLVAMAARNPTKVVMLLSGLARHTQNLECRNKCSLLLVQSGDPSEDPLAGSRLTLVGTACRIDSVNSDSIRTVFLEKHPEAEVYVDFSDFCFYEIDVQSAHLVAGFGWIKSLTPDQL